MKEPGKVLVIGGANYDITATTRMEVIPAESNPSVIIGTCGGVGRNVAENLSHLGADVSLLTAFGDDAMSAAIVKSCEESGIDSSHSFAVGGAAASCYISVQNPAGEMVMAASDLSVLEGISPESFEAQREYIASFPYVFIDANLTPEQLKAAASCVQGMLFADAVSARKAVRLKAILPLIHTLKLNRNELCALTDMPADSPDDLKTASEKLLQKGVKRVITTLGGEGSCCCDETGFIHVPACAAEVVSVNGAGDTFSAALVFAAVNGFENRETLLLGSVAASVCLQSSSAVSSELDGKELIEKSGLHLNGEDDIITRA